MQRIIVIGCPGSGKSTFARALQLRTGLPLYHLDRMYWNADKTVVEKPIFLERLAAALAQEEWIIDGNYASTMELRFASCDTVFFLDYPTSVCLEGVRSRRGIERSDLPWIETEEDAEFIAYINAFRADQRPQILSLLERYSEKRIVIFTDRAQAETFLRGDIHTRTHMD